MLRGFAPGLVTTGWARIGVGKWLFLLGSWTAEIEFPIYRVVTCDGLGVGLVFIFLILYFGVTAVTRVRLVV